MKEQGESTHHHATRHSAKLPPPSKNTANSRVVHKSKLPRKLKKKGSKRKAPRRSSALQKVQVSSDCAPQRLVNPLTEWPPIAVDPETTVAQRVADFIPLIDIMHGRPDTYSIGYLARLLGLEVPPDGIYVGDGVEGIAQQIMLANPEQNSSAAPGTRLIAQPPLGSFYSWKKSDEDRLTLVDPTYTSLLGADKVVFRPISLAQYQRLTQAVAWDSAPLCQMAKECGVWTTTNHTIRPLVAQKRLGWVVPDQAAISCRAGWYAATSTRRAELLMKLEVLQQGKERFDFVEDPPESGLPLGKVAVLPIVPQAPSVDGDVASNVSVNGSAVGTETSTKENPEPVSQDVRDMLKPAALQDQFAAAAKSKVPGEETDENEKSIGDTVSALRQEESAVGQKDMVSVSGQDSANGSPLLNQKASIAVGVINSGGAVEILKTGTATTSTRKPLNDSSGAKIPGSIEKVSNQFVGGESTTELVDTVADEDREGLWVFLLAVAIEHARACGVAYILVDVVPEPFKALMQTCFRMSLRQSKNGCSFLCDLSNCSFKYAFLKFKEQKAAASMPTNEAGSRTMTTSPSDYPPSEAVDDVRRERWLVRWPLSEEIRTGYMSQTSRAMRGNKQATSSVTSLPPQQRHVQVRLRAKLVSPNMVEFHKLSTQPGHSTLVEGPLIDLPLSAAPAPSLDILRTFEPPPPVHADNRDDSSEILQSILAKEAELEALERGLHGKAQSLLTSAIQERLEYEQAIPHREKERELVAEHQKLLQRRKELDMAFQEQQEQDMDAVCAICNDGEVAPDNQILFCEACNVAVHQVCYGIEHVPEGDYYCLACTHLGRQNNNRTAMREGQSIKLAATPLPIVCELCPFKQGAFIQTSVKQREGDHPSFGKWVHMICAKWQGLSFESQRTDMIEDVTEMKIRFRQHKIVCELCRGARGCMNKCRVESCKKWMHVTCARAVGTCVVVHGENAAGPVEKDPWSLLCPEHSDIAPKDVREGSIPVENLILMAKEFPPEPKPPPEELRPKPFNTIGGEERDRMLRNEKYERELLLELTTKKLYGFRCEVCDALEDEGKNLSRCSTCYSVCCSSCTFEADFGEGNFKCPGCQYSDSERKKGGEFVRPECLACCQPGGILRRGFAKPMSKKSFWKNQPKEFAKSLFGRPIWVHSVCAFWQPKLHIMFDTSEVCCSDVVMSSGKSLVLSSTRCCLCGQGGGLKIKCSHSCCSSKRASEHVFHVTCARMAGLEVNAIEEDNVMKFYIHCYRHGSNENNLRAKIEDLIEIEKRRSGPRLSKVHLPMTFAHAQRLLNSSIQVLRMLGWSWRWAEWWVDYDSTWEPLLEPGQIESQMTNEELKKVDSTRGSRCEDARKCRLAALGVALRDRLYDTDEGFDRASLDRALLAMLSTRSLVGPLEDFELKFLTEWLGRGYRSRSKLLGFGDDKIVPAAAEHCLHKVDRSPKFILGERPVPGKQELAEGQVFEPGVKEVDDFLLTEIVIDTPPRGDQVIIAPGRGTAHTPRRRPRGPGRPPSGRFTGRGPGRPPSGRTRGRVSSGRKPCRPPSSGRGPGRPPWRHLSPGRGPGRPRGRPPKPDKETTAAVPGVQPTRTSSRKRKQPAYGVKTMNTAMAVAAVAPSAVKKRQPSSNESTEDVTRNGAEVESKRQAAKGGEHMIVSQPAVASGTPVSSVGGTAGSVDGTQRNASLHVSGPRVGLQRKRRRRWVDRKYHSLSSDASPSKSTMTEELGGPSSGNVTTESAEGEEPRSKRSEDASAKSNVASNRDVGPNSSTETSATPTNSTIQESLSSDVGITPPKRGPGRPRKHPRPVDAPVETGTIPAHPANQGNDNSEPIGNGDTIPQKRRPGRPKKQLRPADPSVETKVAELDHSDGAPTRRSVRSRRNSLKTEGPSLDQGRVTRNRRSVASLEITLKQSPTVPAKRSRRPVSRYVPDEPKEAQEDPEVDESSYEDDIPLSDLADQTGSSSGTNMLYSPSNRPQDSEPWRVRVRRSMKEKVVEAKLQDAEP